MRRRTLLALPALISRAMAAGAVRADPLLRVVASFSVLADMTQQVAGPLAVVGSFVTPDGDVHMYEPRPRDLGSLLAARLLVENGLGLEGWMQRLIGAASFKGVTVIAATGVQPRTMREGGGSMATDPHAWQDPRNGVIYVGNIAEGLVQADPGNAAAFRAAADRYSAALRTTDAWIEAKFAPIPPPARRIITTHDAFGYFGSRYGIEFLAAEGLSTDSEPSARAIAALVEQIRREKIRAVFLESMTDPRLAEMLVRETGAVLGGTVYSDALSPPDGPAATYLEMFRHNTELFTAAMRSS